MVHGIRKFQKYIPFVAWSVVVIGSDVLARCGVIPTWVFYVLLIALHVWIFTKIGIRIYERRKTTNSIHKTMRKKIVAGNWKMNTTPAEGVELAKGIAAGRKDVCKCVELIVAPPFTHLSEVVKATRGTGVSVAAQNCADQAKGAYTGEVSAAMIASLGVEYVILGHSERRQYYGETSETLNRKLSLALENKLSPIYCVGENLDERESNRHFDVVKAQIEEVVFNLNPDQYQRVIIAYEPVWAIGTGKTATSAQAQEMHKFIREVLASKFAAAAAETVILYGGSANPGNAVELFSQPDVDGGLIGGASLVAENFLQIGKSFPKE